MVMAVVVVLAVLLALLALLLLLLLRQIAAKDRGKDVLQHIAHGRGSLAAAFRLGGREVETRCATLWALRLVAQRTTKELEDILIPLPISPTAATATEKRTRVVTRVIVHLGTERKKKIER